MWPHRDHCVEVALAVAHALAIALWLQLVQLCGFLEYKGADAFYLLGSSRLLDVVCSLAMG